MTRDSEAARNETVDAIESKPTPRRLLATIPVAYDFA